MGVLDGVRVAAVKRGAKGGIGGKEDGEKQGTRRELHIGMSIREGTWRMAGEERTCVFVGGSWLYDGETGGGGHRGM